MAADGWYTFNGRDGEVIPPGVTRVRIHESVTVIPAHAFQGNRNIEEVECHIGVKKVKEFAFANCPSLRIVIMPGVKVVKRCAFNYCKALTIVECDKLEIIGRRAFNSLRSLRSINLPSARVVEGYAFCDGEALTDVKFGKELESIGEVAFYCCTSLERITIPLKDSMITDDNVFRGCENLKHVDLVEERVIRETIDALLLEEWNNDMNRDMSSIDQILSYTHAGGDIDAGGKALVIRMWISSVLHKIIHYKAEHQRYLNEAASTLQRALPQDIMVNNVLPFLELPNIAAQHESNLSDEDR
eukprot:scaffold755_cov83-Skeletonema_dohrnii-CCMP3373.AAC.4